MIKFNELFEVKADANKNKKNEVLEYGAKDDDNFVNYKDEKPWIDKYRPKKLDDVVYQDEVIKMLKTTLQTGNLPHLLFHGPPGTGKTSTILAMAMELFGPKLFKDRVIELNASDERGINVVRNKIVALASMSIGNKDPNYLSPPYKIIILDEADAMTTEAQSALRKIMEDKSTQTRFCFICNYINQIIEPINSRCVKFRFKSLTEECIVGRLKHIAECESLKMSDQALSAVSTISEGDMRKAVMLLQNLKYTRVVITVKEVFDMSGHVPSKVVDMIKKVCVDSKVANLKKVIKLAKYIHLNGFPTNCVMGEINRLTINDTNLTDVMKAKICMHLSKTEKRLIDGADEYLQLLSVLMCIKNIVLGVNSEQFNVM